MVDSLAKRLRNHPEFGRRLVWLDAASDDELKQAYLHASGVLLASRGEGLACRSSKPRHSNGLSCFVIFRFFAKSQGIAQLIFPACRLRVWRLPSTHGCSP